MIYMFVVYLEKSGKMVVVILIYENCGLIDWVWVMVDKFVGEGYFVFVLDMFLGVGFDGGWMKDFLLGDVVCEVIGKLKVVDVVVDFGVVVDYV